MVEDPRLAEAKAMPIHDVAASLGILDGLRQAGAEYIGPCPICGGKNRFAINTQKNVWLCRSNNGGCGVGGDGVKLVMHIKGCTFPEALSFMVGERDLDEDPDVARRRAEAAQRDRQRRDAQSERYRQRSIRDALQIYSGALPSLGTPVEEYLRLRRALAGPVPRCIRFLPNHRYVKKIDGSYVTLHEGPAMITPITAPVAGPDGPQIVIRAVHQTWIDLDQPKGKAVILHPETREPISSKLVRGSKKGGAMRLVFGSNEHLIMGEGIETTLSAWAARVDPKANFWAGVDLGNMAGRMSRRPGEPKLSGRPDMSDADAFHPPPNIRRLTYIQDGDSDLRRTRAQLECGLKRAMAINPGLTASIVFAGKGRDLNDLAMESDAEGRDG